MTLILLQELRSFGTQSKNQDFFTLVCTDTKILKLLASIKEGEAILTTIPYYYMAVPASCWGLSLEVPYLRPNGIWFSKSCLNLSNMEETREKEIRGKIY